jgi:hypothetical protein
MIMFAWLIFVVAAGAFWLLLRVSPEGAFLAILRVAALAVLGLMLLWSGCGVVVEWHEARRIDAWRAERARLEAFRIPVSEIEILEPTLGPGGHWGAVMEALVRNHSTSRTLYRVSYRWSASYCVVPGDCKSIERQSDQLFDGIGPGREYRSREDVAIDIGPQGLNIPRDVSSRRVPVTIQLIEARGR